MKPPITHSLLSAALLLGACLSPSSAYAALLVYEGFNYAVSEGDTMNGVASTATGLTGSYAVSTSGTSSSTYSTSGLTFSNFFASSGGALGQNAASGGITFAGVLWNAGTAAGNLYSSALVNVAAFANDSAATSLIRINTGATSSGATASFQSAPEATGTASAKPGVGYDSTVAQYGGTFNMSASTTYLMISKFSNVGTALSALVVGRADLWLFNQASYDSWRTTGGGLESALGNYANATATESLTSGIFSLGNSNFVQFADFSPSSASAQTLKYDELRYGTSLGDVAVIPEPATATLMVVSMAIGFLLLRRRRYISL